MIRCVRALLLAAVALLAPGTATAAGGNRVDYFDTSDHGIDDPSSQAHLYAVPSGNSTAVIKLRSNPDYLGRTLETRTMNGYWRINAVASDMSTAGISADGSVLVLAGYGRPGPKLTLLETERLKRTETIQLDGDFSLDAVSPDGGTIYLVHYLDPRDPLRYEVVAYDVEAARLLPEPIIDERLAPEVMRGMPLTRANSPDGAWAYTLYDGGGGHHAEPFVHALDTANAKALCIDLPMLAEVDVRDLPDVRLEPGADGATIAVLDPDGETLASIETGTWEASEGATEVAEAEAAGTSPLPFVAGAIALLAALLLGGRATRRSAR